MIVKLTALSNVKVEQISHNFQIPNTEIGPVLSEFCRHFGCKSGLCNAPEKHLNLGYRGRI